LDHTGVLKAGIDKVAERLEWTSFGRIGGEASATLYGNGAILVSLRRTRQLSAEAVLKRLSPK